MNLLSIRNFPEVGAYWHGPGSFLLYTFGKYFAYVGSSGVGYYSYDLYNWIQMGGNFINANENLSLFFKKYNENEQRVSNLVVSKD